MRRHLYAKIEVIIFFFHKLNALRITERVLITKLLYSITLNFNITKQTF